MAGVSFDVNKSELSKILLKLDALQDMDYQPALQESARILLAEQQENHDKQGALYQGGGFIRGVNGAVTTPRSAWAPLAPRTVRERILLGFPGKRPILERTGRGRRGYKVSKLTSDTVSIINDVPYMAKHQTGDPTTNLPQRKIMGFTNKSKTAIALTIFRQIVDSIRK